MKKRNKAVKGARTVERVRVKADIEYMDGALKGVYLPFGYSVGYPNRDSAMRVCRWIERVMRENDFVRATGTGNRYQFKSVPLIVES